MTDTRPLFAALSFGLLSLAFGYVAATAYLMQTFYGTLDQIDWTFLARNVRNLYQFAPREAAVAGTIMGVALLLPIGAAKAVRNESLSKFGRARWQSALEMRRTGFRRKLGEGFLLGKLTGPRMLSGYVVSDTAPHCLMVAPSGRGKGRGFVIPNLLTHPGSLVCLDVKGENWTHTARVREAAGDTVIRFSPHDPANRSTHRYNPLARIAALTDADDRMMELRQVADLFLVDDGRNTGLLGGGKDIFVACAMLAIENGRPTLGETYRLATDGGDKNKHYASLATTTQNPNVHRILHNLSSINDRTLTSYLSLLLTSGLGQWANPTIDAATAMSDFSFRDLRRKRTSIYMVVPLNMFEPLAPLIRLFFSDLVASLQSAMPRDNETVPVLIMLDEFDRLGPMTVVANALKTMRGYGAHIAVVTQSLPGLDSVYGVDQRMAILAGCGLKVFMTPSDQRTTDELSKMLGETTRRVVTKSAPPGLSSMRSRSISERSETAPLMSSDQVRGFPVEDVMILGDGVNPIRAKGIKWYEDWHLKKLVKAVAKKPEPMVPVLESIAYQYPESSAAATQMRQAVDEAAAIKAGLDETLSELKAAGAARPVPSTAAPKASPAAPASSGSEADPGSEPVENLAVVQSAPKGLRSRKRVKVTAVGPEQGEFDLGDVQKLRTVNGLLAKRASLAGSVEPATGSEDSESVAADDS